MYVSICTTSCKLRSLNECAKMVINDEMKWKKKKLEQVKIGKKKLYLKVHEM